MTTLSPSSRILRNPWGVARTKLEARGEEDNSGHARIRDSPTKRQHIITVILYVNHYQHTCC